MIDTLFSIGRVLIDIGQSGWHLYQLVTSLI